MVSKIIEDYTINNLGIESICEKYHVGKLKVKKILTENQIPLRKRGAIKRNQESLKITDYHIQKYLPKEGYHYIAKDKISGKIFNDYMNQGGFLTTHIKNEYNIEIPSLYERRQYYMKTGNYWWEQWFDIIEIENSKTKKCPFCEWETIDIENKSGAFEKHLQEKHNFSKGEYLELYPNDIDYFTISNNTQNRQMCENENEFVTCAICGKKFARINDKHLQKHGITRLDYIKKYGNNVYSQSHYQKLLKSAKKMNISMDGRHDIFISKPEKEIMNFIQSNGIDCKKNRSLLNGMELDVFIPSKNLAIEFNGNQYHTETFGGKDSKYHLNKTLKCNELGINLIHIFEDEYFYKRDIVLNKLQHILDINTNLPKIYGRKCQIKTIPNNLAKVFLDRFHIQGFAPATLYYGAFYDDKLIGVMSFLKIKDKHWELNRFASDYNYICCGIGGKLLNCFINENDPIYIKSFADRRWTCNMYNNLYTKLGFQLECCLPPNYTYYNSHVDRYKRFHKFNFRKQILLKKHSDILNENMTENEMTKILGYDRIWDCGLLKYVWKNNR